MELELPNVAVAHVRAEEYRPQTLFDMVTARAFGPLSVLWGHARRLLAPGGRLLAMKGAVVVEEAMKDVRNPAEPEGAAVQTAAIIPLTVPGLAAERHLVIVER